jgi:hypothetical protein
MTERRHVAARLPDRIYSSKIKGDLDLRKSQLTET